jgi:HAD superfamily hydrolase (TIGR01509 family)
MPKMLKAIIFDFDGVVVDSEPLIFEAAKKVFAKYGVDLTFEDIQPGIGAGSSYLTHPLKKYGLTGVTVEELVKQRAAAYLEIARTKLKKMEGFDNLIQEVQKRNLKTALASSSPNRWIAKSLEAAAIDPKLFNVIVDGDSVPRKKPFPDLFLKAAEGLGLSPRDCVVIEDALPGIEAARRAGIRCIALAGTMREEQLGDADIVALRLADVPNILDTI